jgi:hypothetical protein
MNMKPEIKAKWVEALRSGEYKQGKGLLAEDNKFCCLGVLCEVSGMPYDHVRFFLPNEVKEWAGLDSRNPMLPTGDLLSDLNDNGKRFTTIANLIEKLL